MSCSRMVSLYMTSSVPCCVLLNAPANGPVHLFRVLPHLYQRALTLICSPTDLRPITVLSSISSELRPASGPDSWASTGKTVGLMTACLVVGRDAAANLSFFRSPWIWKGLLLMLLWAVFLLILLKHLTGFRENFLATYGVKRLFLAAFYSRTSRCGVRGWLDGGGSSRQEGLLLIRRGKKRTTDSNRQRPESNCRASAISSSDKWTNNGQHFSKCGVQVHQRFASEAAPHGNIASTSDR